MKIKINKEKRNLKLITNTIKYIEKTNEYKGNIKIKKYVIKQSKKFTTWTGTETVYNISENISWIICE